MTEDTAQKTADEFVRLLRRRGGDEDPGTAHRRMQLSQYLDIINSDLPLDYPRDRWLLGRIEGDWFIPLQDRIDRVPLAAELRRPFDPRRLWLAHVRILRDGSPAGPIDELAPSTNEL